MNILLEGEKIIGSRTTEFGAKRVCSCSATLVENPTTERWQHRNVLTVDDPIGNNLLKSSGSLKQEIRCGKSPIS